MTEAGTSQADTANGDASESTGADVPGDGTTPPSEPPSGRPKGASRWKTAFVALLVLGVLGTASWMLLGSKLLVVRHVEVTGTKLAPRDRIVATAGIRLGVPMVRLDTGEVRGRVERLREVKSAKVERRWPATVRIVVHERVPLVMVERAGRYYQLDEDGVTVADSPARPPKLPALSATAPGPTDPATLAALHVVAALPDRLGRRVVGVEAPSPESVTLRLSGGPSVVWGSDDRPEEKLRLFDALLKTPAGRAAHTIDVSSPEVVTTR
ncbi:FtsQ-type POTRA domain-containing protein [Actinomadura barringtoniae]|uniref:FtsQ-type POTRA domain-containing protein n=1 Tax=Actinomadura barringtoniae TaxID=1427535 RepID=A0A939PGP6_9ACTN|nr:FtsQ-type POTRA domain-containing protein [Actinomadura barringtoniae]MBO2452325.1 FtsQ-type POTRA domain-containing protein [Actinomadura barringtoniae]